TEDVLVPLQVALLALSAIGLLVSFRWVAVAAAIVALAGAGIGVFATLEYEPPFGLGVFVAFLGPAVLLWLAWQHRATFGRIAVLAVATAALLLASWYGASEVYAAFLGPQHPGSTTPALPDSPVRWLWSGAVTTDGFAVRARLREEAAAVRLVVRDAAGGTVAVTAPRAVTEPEAAVAFAVDGLEPATRYGYAVEIDGVLDEVHTGTLRTFPAGPASFTVAVGACARANSNGAVFDTIRAADPDLYLNVGDLHYRNITTDDLGLFRGAYAGVNAPAAQSALYRSVPIAYVWDDHDFGGDAAVGSSAGRPAAWAAYRENVPHYPLRSGAEGPIYQAFTIGRVRFVLLDTRSERDPEAGSLLGEDQLRWLMDELLSARDTHALTVLASSIPWIAPAEPGSDNWGGFAAERERIGAFLADNDISNLVMVAGDAHMIALDDGTNTGYGGAEGFPLLHVGALDRPGSVKGGPYSHGTFPGAGHLGLVEVRDTGGEDIAVTLIGRDYTGADLVRYERTFRVGVRGSELDG
ncbi:MAG: alkaline phosphatase family protein, partial [Acidimicrobiia bacterium]|nr:alkaline phosphatase family protein [Acidimicrobiia bacterium]